LRARPATEKMIRASVDARPIPHRLRIGKKIQ